ncbi:MAG: hypothetical protein QNJ73_01065 [Gammaproteobacteria bacterium]|nr:hypothetical protein [Gammaproteobacteria bacterium]
MAALARITKYCGVATAALLGASIVLFGLLLLALGLADDCQEGALSYSGCTWRGADVSREITLLSWVAILTFLLFLASGLIWLTSKVFLEWRDPERSFARWWLLLFAVIVLLAIFADRIVFWFAS